MTNGNRNILEFVDVRIEPQNFKIFKAGRELSLEPKVFKLLLFLIENRGRLVEKNELLDAVWKDAFVTENALTREIAKLRKALGDDSKTPKYIQTVHTQGYRFIAEIEETEESRAETKNDLAPPAQTDTFAPLRKGAALHFLSLKTLVVFGIMASAFAVGFIVWKTRQEQTEAVRFLKPTQMTTWTSLDIYPSFSPDGNSIAYSSDHGGNFEIYVKPLAPGGNEIRLTSDGQQNFQPAFSPDGKFIAFYSKNRGGIWVIPASGGKIKQITTFGSRPAWSPDGNFIAFQSMSLNDLGAVAIPGQPPSTIWVVPANGSAEPTQITQVGNPPGGHGVPAWSPDGIRIVLCASDFGSTSIWTITSKGDDPKQITKGYPALDPVYSPHGESVYYSTFSGMWKIRISPTSGEPIGEPVKLTSSSSERIRHFSISVDGKKIAYAALLINSNIWSVTLTPDLNPMTETAVPLTQTKALRHSLPAFSPDGKRIAFNTQNVSREGEGDIWLMDADGKNSAQVTTEGGILPSWFPDGEQLAFLSSRNQSKAWTTNLKTGQERHLLDFGEDVNYQRLSPEGKQIVYNSKKGGTTNVWTIPVAGGEAKQITFDKEFAGFACWSPDGKTVGVQIKRGDDSYVAVMSGEGGEITQLTFDKGQSWPHSFSPDGDKIIFAGFRNGFWNLYWVSRSTKVQKQLTNYTKLNSYVRYPAWSPLGNQIAYEYAETTGNIWIGDLK